MVAEHTKSRGRVDVVEGRRRLQLGRAWISVTNFFSEDLFSRPCLQHRLPPPLSPHTAAELGLGEELPLIPPILLTLTGPLSVSG